MSSERLQKILAQAGIASRRKAEEIIEEGRVTVNGKVAKVGDKAEFGVDHIKVDGKLLKQLEDPFYVVMNKPKGVISMMFDPEGRPTLADYLSKVKAHLYPIGRLDFNSEGLILLTNDGALAEKIQKSDAFPRIYHVKIKGHITTEMISRLQRGIRLANKFVKPMSVRIHEELNKKTRIEIVFLNAANVDVKSFFESKGFLVEKITRTGIGHLTLHGLEPGHYRIVNKSKFEALVEQPELGVRAIEHRYEKESEILPRDQRIRNVDIHGKIIPKTPTSGRVAGLSSKAAGKAGSPTVRIQPKAEAIVVKAHASGPKPNSREGKKYGGSIDLPRFKKRSMGPTAKRTDSPSAGRSRSGPKPSGRPIARIKRRER